MGKKERVVVFGIGFVLLLIFTFTDLQISETLFTKNLYGRICEVIGELPFEFLAVFAAVLLIRFRRKEHLAGNIAAFILWGLFAGMLAAMGGFMTMNYLNDNLATAVPGVFAVVVAAILLFGAICLANRVPEGKSREAVSYAVTAVIYFVAVLIVMNVLKGMWGRMRMREMTEPAIQFTRWYVRTDRGGFDNIYASFPSGHTMNSAAVVLLTLLPSFLPELAGRERLLKGIAYAWILAVGISRVIMGAHFASDVIMGALLSLVLFDVTNQLVKRCRKNSVTKISSNKICKTKVLEI